MNVRWTSKTKQKLNFLGNRKKAESHGVKKLEPRYKNLIYQ